MVARIALMGVHGVGKTTVCRLLGERLGIPCFEVENEDFLRRALGAGSPVDRQFLFMRWYLKRYREAPRHCVIDAHPLMVVAYTEYFLGLEPAEFYADVVRGAVMMRPEFYVVDHLVLLEPPSIDVLVDRISGRPDWRKNEEIDRRYLENISKNCRVWFLKLGSKVAHKTHRVVAVNGADKVADMVLEIVKN